MNALLTHASLGPWGLGRAVYVECAVGTRESWLVGFGRSVCGEYAVGGCESWLVGFGWSVCVARAVGARGPLPVGCGRVMYVECAVGAGEPLLVVLAGPCMWNALLALASLGSWGVAGSCMWHALLALASLCPWVWPGRVCGGNGGAGIPLESAERVQRRGGRVGGLAWLKAGWNPVEGFFP